MMHKTTGNQGGMFTNNFYMLKLLLKLCPGRVAATLLQSIFDYFGWVFYSIIFIRTIFSSIEKQSSFTNILIFIVFSMVIFCVLNFYSSWYHTRYRPLTDQILTYKINSMLFNKVSSVNISCYENPEFYNNYTKALTEANGRAIAVLDNMAGIVASLLSSSYVIYTMFTLDYFIAFFVIIPVVASFIFGKFINKVNFQNSQDDVPYNRKKDYVNRAVFLKKYAKEIRLSNIFNVLKDTYNNGYDGILHNVDKYKNKSFILRFLQAFLCYPLVFESVWLFAAYRAIVSKTLNTADFVVLATAIVSATNMLFQLVNNIIRLSENGLYINNFKTFLNYKEKTEESQNGLIPDNHLHTLEFKDVSFTYDEQNCPVLQHINFKINAGEKIALVGYNGAGKTTLIKLMMRLYDVTEGEILLNGINIKEYNIKQYRQLFGTVFQDYQIFSMSVLENIIMNEVTDENQRHHCQEALKKSGVYDKVKSLKHGVDTTLTREFDDEGAVLSGGEFQKLAIARALSKQSPIIIMDEPSSALDPIAEYEMYESLAKAYEEKENQKMVVLISHRLSTAVLADKVIFLNQGEIIEQGTHEQLLNKNGKYAEMFLKQAQNYMENIDELCFEEEVPEI